MDKKLKRRLINALKSAGMSEGLAESLEDASTETIEQFIKDLRSVDTDASNLEVEDLLDSEVLIEAVETLGFDKLLERSKKMQSAHDKKVAKGLSTFKKKLLNDGEEEEEEGGDKKPKVSDDAPDWFKQYVKSVDDRLDKLTKTATVTSKLSDAKKLISESKVIPKKLHEKFLKQFNLEGDESLEDQLKNIETDFKDIYGEIAGDGTYEFSEEGSASSKTGKLTASEEEELAEAAKSL